MNRIVKVLPYGLLIFALTACGGVADNTTTNTDGESVSGDQEKITLRIIGGQDYFMELVVAEFNKQNPNCFVTYENLDEGKPMSDSYTSINAELVSDKAPDILNFNEVDWLNYKKSGIFADLTPYIDRDDDIQLSDYLQNAISAYQIGGATYCIPVQFGLHGWIGSSYSVGPDGGWTIDESLSFLEKYPETALEWYGSKPEILCNCLMFNLDDFIDTDTGISHLKDQKFREIVQRIQNIPLVAVNQGDEAYKVILGQGGSTLAECFWNQPKDFLKKDTAYYNAMSYKGYPDESGKFTARLNTTGCVGIVATGKHQDAAWEFVKYYLEHYSDTKQRVLGIPTFSTKISELEDQLKVLRSEIYQEEEDGTQTLLPIAYNKNRDPIYPLTEQELELYRDIIDNAQVLSPEDEKFLYWIMKDMALYYGGQKNLDDAIDSVHRKIQIYLDERK